MKKTGQIFLVSISILFTLSEHFLSNESFNMTTFLLGIIIAWFLGWQYDKLKLSEQNRKESEESYKHLIEMMPEAVVIHRNHIVLYANKAAELLVGAKKKDDLVGSSILDFLAPDYKEKAVEERKQVEKDKSPSLNTEYKLISLNVKNIFCEFSSRYILFEGKEAILSIGKDITDKKEQTESLLQKSEKLALVGQLAAGIAHEIRNPLTAIKGFIQLSREQKDHQQKYLSIVSKELERIELIVGEFLVLAKPNVVKFQMKDIKPLLEDVVELINTQAIMDNVQIDVQYDPNIPSVFCEENLLKQVFINLLKNGIESMPGGGTVKVKVENRGKGQISLLFIDEGIGISEERLKTLGEPFYTTKEKETGLGLMTCIKIVESHKGELNIYSKVNEGTIVKVILPVINLSNSRGLEKEDQSTGLKV